MQSAAVNSRDLSNEEQKEIINNEISDCSSIEDEIKVHDDRIIAVHFK